MTRRLANPLPRSVIVRLAGSANSSETQRAKGIKGQAVTQERYGGDQLRRAQLRSRGFNVASIAPSKAKPPRGNEGASRTTEGQGESND